MPSNNYAVYRTIETTYMEEKSLLDLLRTVKAFVERYGRDTETSSSKRENVLMDIEQIIDMVASAGESKAELQNVLRQQWPRTGEKQPLGMIRWDRLFITLVDPHTYFTLNDLAREFRMLVNQLVGCRNAEQFAVMGGGGRSGARPTTGEQENLDIMEASVKLIEDAARAINEGIPQPAQGQLADAFGNASRIPSLARVWGVLAAFQGQAANSKTILKGESFHTLEVNVNKLKKFVESYDQFLLVLPTVHEIGSRFGQCILEENIEEFRVYANTHEEQLAVVRERASAHKADK